MLKTSKRTSAIRRATLRLHGETIAHLTRHQLHAVVGGERTVVECTVGCESWGDDCPMSQGGPCDPKTGPCPVG